LTVAGQTFTVTQAGASCSYGIGNITFTPQQTGVLMNVPVTTATGCGWTATSNATWITVQSGGSGNGSGSAVFALAPNMTRAARTGVVVVGGIQIQITQQ
jgi:hypothetical protein